VLLPLLLALGEEPLRMEELLLMEEPLHMEEPLLKEEATLRGELLLMATLREEQLRQDPRDHRLASNNLS